MRRIDTFHTEQSEESLNLLKNNIFLTPFYAVQNDKNKLNSVDALIIRQIYPF